MCLSWAKNVVAIAFLPEKITIIWKQLLVFTWVISVWCKKLIWISMEGSRLFLTKNKLDIVRMLTRSWNQVEKHNGYINCSSYWTCGHNDTVLERLNRNTQRIQLCVSVCSVCFIYIKVQIYLLIFSHNFYVQCKKRLHEFYPFQGCKKAEV